MTIDESKLVDFYENAHLAESQTDAVLSAGQFAADARKWRRIAMSTSIGFLLVAVLAGWLFVRGERYREIAKERSSSDEPAPRRLAPKTSVPPTSDSEPARELPRFRLVAFRSHDDGCPNCKATGQLYADLKDQLKDEAIDFENFELQKTEVFAETMARIESQKLTSLVAGRNETAFAVLLSPDGSPLQQFNPLDGVDRVHAAISGIVDQ